MPAGARQMIYFAPMEGITDGILRRVHSQIFGGVDTYCLPFHKLTQSATLTAREKRDISPEENQGLHVLPQALTRDPDQLLTWLRYAADLGYPCADLNIGCPSPTVTKRGRGSGMLRDLVYLRAFFEKVFSNKLPIPLSVKTRIGYESKDEWPGILDILKDYPFAHVTIHVRTMREQYTGGIHPESFDLAREKGLSSLVYNGDLRTPQDCAGKEAVMIGRGLLADPSLARRIKGGAVSGEDELREWYMRLYDGWTERFHAALALGRIKKLAEWPIGNDVKMKRLLRRADNIEDCIAAILLQH